METVNKNNKRDAFIFYRPFFEAIEKLSKRNKLIAYEAIVKYALNQEIVDNLPKGASIILGMAIKQIDANHKKYSAKIKMQKQKLSSDFEDEIQEKIPLPKKKNRSTQSNCITEDDLNESENDSISNHF